MGWASSGPLAALAAAVVCAAPGAVAAAQTDPRAAETVLAPEQSEGDLVSFLGVPAAGCVPASSTTRLCEWVLDARNPRWRALSSAIETEDRVGVLCELPLGEGVRESGSCTAHRRRSNRKLFEGHGAKRNTGAEKRRHQRRREELGKQAQAELDRSRTLVSRSRLLGAAPASCRDHSETERFCLWRLSNHTYGHGTVAATIGAPMGKKVRLRCFLPLDGSERRADSCNAEIGA